jgi:heptosyltransferase-2
VQNETRSILVIQTAFLGDALLCLPTLRVLKKRFPLAKITFACRNGYGDFFRSIGIVSEVIDVDKSSLRAQRRSYLKLKHAKPDLIVCLQRSVRSAIWVRFLGAKKSIGFKSWWNVPFFNERVRRPMEKHDVLRQLAIIGADQEESSLKTELPPSAKFIKYKGSFAIAPGSQWPTKRWTEEGIVSLGRELLASGEKIVIVGSRAEIELAQRITARLPGAVNLCGQTTILELAQLLKECKSLVSNDSGPMHMASLVEIPVVAVFGPTTVDLGYSPWNPRARIAEVNLGCRPCGRHGHRKCPIGTHACMKQVTSSMVLSKLGELGVPVVFYPRV